MPSARQLTQRQIRRIEKLPNGHKVVNTRHGAPTVRRSDGQLFRVQPKGRVDAALRVERVKSYLDVHG